MALSCAPASLLPPPPLALAALLPARASCPRRAAPGMGARPPRSPGRGVGRSGPPPPRPPAGAPAGAAAGALVALGACEARRAERAVLRLRGEEGAADDLHERLLADLAGRSLPAPVYET